MTRGTVARRGAATLLKRGAIGLAVVAGLMTPAIGAAEDASGIDTAHLPGPAKWQDLPDWSGVWRETRNTIFDHATVQPPGASSGTPGAREFPPLTEKWEKVYAHNRELVSKGQFPDPITMCGVPAGFPRVFNLPDVYEFVVRPEESWLLSENGPNVMRIYTDGRDDPAKEDRWLTYTGDSVGYWDGDTLVFSTVAVKNEGTILDRTGLTLSDEMTSVTRMRKIADDLIEAELIITDPIALTEPWHVTVQFERLPDGARVYDYACAENNRNPVTDSGHTITLGPDGKPLDGSSGE